MIPILRQEFPILLGKLGMWPSDFTQEAAVALYEQILINVKPGETVVDWQPGSGKSSVIAAAAAIMIGAKLQVYGDLGHLFCQRAFRLFGLDREPSISIAAALPSQADFLIVHPSCDINTLPGSPPIAFSLSGPPMTKYGTLEHSGNGWSLWRKKEDKLPVIDLMETSEPIEDNLAQVGL